MTLLLFACLLAAVGVARADPPLPVEPENDNSEYVLDLVTSDYHPGLLRAWESGDNRLRFRLGSNSVDQWFIEEELKLAASLIENRWRFRYRHARLHRHSGERIDADTFEFELRPGGHVFVSAFITPSSVKADNAVGVVFQHRRRVDRFILYFLEFPHVARNVIEREKDNSDEFITVFDKRPFRFGLSIREEPVSGLRVRLDGELVTEFVVMEEVQRTGAVTRKETVGGHSLSGDVEYERRVHRDHNATIAGVAFGFRRVKRDNAGSREPPAPGSAREPGPSRLTALEFDAGLYAIGALDTLTGWETDRSWVRPYLWFDLDDRWTLRGAIHFEEREIERIDGGSAVTITNRYVVPRAGVRFDLGARRQSSLEFGWASSFRERESLSQSIQESVDIQDNRLYLAYELRINDATILRAIESFDLDREDRGKFWIHDHAFLQLVFGF